MASDIFRALRPALVLVGLFVLLLGFAYPFAILGLGQALFPHQANGSLVREGGKVIGSERVGQAFTSPRYFNTRPSAAGKGYDANASSGSNMGPTNKALADRIATGIAAQRAAGVTGEIPADLVLLALGFTGAKRALLDEHDAITRKQLAVFRGREIRSTGDGFLAVFDGAARAVRCAGAIRDALRPLDLPIRAGVHSGEIESRGGGVDGIAVHIATRVAETAAAGEVIVSQTVKDLTVGGGLTFDDRGVHPLKGVPGEWRMFAVET